MAAVATLVMVFGLVALIWASARAREICVLSVRRGRVLVLRGALPASLLEALADVVERQQCKTGLLRVLRDGDRARLEARGLDEHAAQRARNVLGTYPLQRVLAAGSPREQNLGQRLGISWLAWRLHDQARHRPPKPPQGP